jgi:DNA ligase-associated metallophosphoesterase
VSARGEEIAVGGKGLFADFAGAIFWPEQKLLAIADLHLEKGSSFAKKGVLLPPYDTAATLGTLARALAHYQPRVVVALGDSFHDSDGPARIADNDRVALRALQRGRDWIWIAGNHDPGPAQDIGGSFVDMLAVDTFVFRHEPSAKGTEGEIAGHLHPLARVIRRGRSVARRCFATDGKRVVMPAFGAYAGGLNVRNRIFHQIFGTLAFTAHMLGDSRLYAITATQCLPD